MAIEIDLYLFTNITVELYQYLNNHIFLDDCGRSVPAPSWSFTESKLEKYILSRIHMLAAFESLGTPIVHDDDRLRVLALIDTGNGCKI